MLTTTDQLEAFGVSAVDVGEQVMISTGGSVTALSPAQARKFAFYLAAAYHRAGLEMDRRLGETDNLRDRVLLALRVEPLTKGQLSDVLNEEGYRIGHALRSAELEQLVKPATWTGAGKRRFVLTCAGVEFLEERRRAAA